MTRDRYWLHIFGLWAIVVAQPLLQSVAAAPEFFVAHRAGREEILIVVGVLVLGCPMLLSLVAWMAGFAGARLRTVVVSAIVGLLVALLAVQFLKQAGVNTGRVAVPLAAVAGVGGAFLYARATAVRMFASVLAPLALAVPVMFLARPGIARLVWPAAEAGAVMQASGGVSAPRETPIVMVVLDELPLVSLLDAEGRIDPLLYPNFAALARDGIWYRHATTVSDYTRWALPAIVTGRWPRADAAPNAADYPDSVFTLLGRTHGIEGVEAVTQLCPERLCGPPAEPLTARLRMMADDLRIVYLHVVLTDDLKEGLPALTGDWANFGQAGEANRRRRGMMRRERLEARRNLDNLHARTRVARAFIRGISADDEQPSFYFLHTMLSHTPLELLPDGRINATRSSNPLLDLPRALPGKYKDAWTDDEWAVAQNYQRHLLQAGFVDRIVGELVARLKDQGLYDRALLIVLADHGIAFRSGYPRRDYTPATAADIVRIPLFVKFPAGLSWQHIATSQVGGQRVSDRNVETIDLVPTIAEVAGVALPWRSDGSSLLREPADRKRKTLLYESATRAATLAADEPRIDEALARKIAIFNGPENFYRVPRPPRFARLVGRPIDALEIRDGSAVAEVAFLSEFDTIVDDADEVPFDVGGRLTGAVGHSGRIDLAVAVNGVVRSVTHTWRRQPDAWLATPPLDAWNPSGNEIEVFLIEGTESAPVLRRTTLREAS